MVALETFRERFSRQKFLLKSLALSVMTFLLVFTPQFFVNYFQCGSIFNFPYIYHDEANAGFEFSMLSTGIPVLVKANLAFFTLGLVGLLTLRDRALRIILILWVVPLLLFFFGYKCVESDAVRFLLPLFPAMSAAFCCSRVWEKCSYSDVGILVVLFAASILLVCPSAYSWGRLYPFDMQNYPWGDSVAKALNLLVPVFVFLGAAFMALKHKWTQLIVVVCFAVLYFACLPWAFAALYVLVGGWALFGCGRELKVFF